MINYFKCLGVIVIYKMTFKFSYTFLEIQIHILEFKMLYFIIV